MNPIPLNVAYETSIPALVELMRRAVDGTVIPMFVDYVNNRIIIGATAVSAAIPGVLEVNGGDIKIIGSGNGLQLQDTNGNFYRLTMATDGAIVATQL